MTYIEILERAKKHLVAFPDYTNGILNVIWMVTPYTHDPRKHLENFKNEEVPEKFQGEFWHGPQVNSKACWWDISEAIRHRKIEELNELKANFLQHLIDKHNAKENN